MSHGLEGKERKLQKYKDANSQEKQVRATVQEAFALGHPEKKAVLPLCALSMCHQLLQSKALGVMKASIILQIQH